MPKASRRLAAMLKGIERAELFAIDPRATPGVVQFDGYAVLGRSAVEDRIVAEQIAGMIADAVFDPPRNLAKGCRFVPHHGVRFDVTGGRSIACLLCFTCGDARLTRGDAEEWFWMQKEARADFDSLFATYGVPVPVVD